jgi:hypothetical protein
MGWGTFWVIFLQTHLVTLDMFTFSGMASYYLLPWGKVIVTFFGFFCKNVVFLGIF